MKEDIKYPIYSFKARWSQDGVWDAQYPHQHEGLLEGRIWNGTSFQKMYKEEQTQEQLDAYIQDWWEKYLIEKNKDGKFPIKNPELDYLKAEYKEHETWLLTWFSHETFDTGQTDEEAIKSFEDYIRRVENHNYVLERQFPESEWYNRGYKTLMGAEDRWRWRGGGTTIDDKDPYPCRCKHCKKAGVLRIGH